MASDSSSSDGRNGSLAEKHLNVKTLEGTLRSFTLQRDSLTKAEILELAYGAVTENLLFHVRVQTASSRQLCGDTAIRAGPDGWFDTCFILGRLRAGKGGFGSLLRGSGAAQKKTTNFDACRDMSGRRMRHVNAEKKLREWRQEAGERKLEKVAQDYIKKLARDQKQEAEATAVVGSIKEMSHETMDRVAEAVKLGIQKSKLSDLEKKRKRDAPGAEDRKGKGELRAWSDVAPGLAGLQEEDEEESEVEDGEEEEEDEEEDEEEEEAVRLEGAGVAGSSGGGGSKEASLAAPESKQSQDSQSNVQPSTKRLRSDSSTPAVPELVRSAKDSKDTSSASTSSPASSSRGDDKSGSGSASPEAPRAASQGLTPGGSEKDSSSQPAKADAKTPPPDGPLDWTKISSAADLEAYGLEWLKAELTKSGLKCGGTLHERAARLFLLKDTPLDKVDKKHLARPPQRKA